MAKKAVKKQPEPVIRDPLDFKIKITCKTEKQKEFLKDLRNGKKEIVFGIGSPGTGKSYISLAYALEAIKNGEFKDITMIIPTIQAGGADMGFGYLQGSLDAKTRMFKECDEQTIIKLLRNSGNKEPELIAQELIKQGYIKYEFLNFLLGKTFDNTLIMFCETEQLTVSNMRLGLTRLGENSKIVITGDTRQTNRQSICNNRETSGLIYATQVLADMEEVSVTEFSNDDIVRNGLITKILLRFDN